jgi:hypothetical protein
MLWDRRAIGSYFAHHSTGLLSFALGGGGLLCAQLVHLAQQRLRLLVAQLFLQHLLLLALQNLSASSRSAAER